MTDPIDMRAFILTGAANTNTRPLRGYLPHRTPILGEDGSTPRRSLSPSRLAAGGFSNKAEP